VKKKDDAGSIIELARRRGKTPAWLNEAQRGAPGPDGKAKPIANLRNALLAMRNDEFLRGLFRRDTMMNATMLMKPIDASEGAEGFEPRPATDDDYTKTQEYLQRIFVRLPKDIVHQAADCVAYENRFHPIREWLDGLHWDKVPRVERWLEVYFGAEPSEYTRGVGQMFLISMVARIFKPGAKVDHMLIFEGPQGKLKSSACGVVAGGKWFSDSLPDLDKASGKDVSQHLRGKWLIEVAELHAFSRAEYTKLKSFVSRREERYRPSYGRLEVFEPRQCVFAGTTNADAYLKDPTGDRRYWPVKVEEIDIAGLQRDREQLFAEAVELYHADVPWWPDKDFETTHIMPQQAERYDADCWEEQIEAYLKGETKVTVGMVARLALGIEAPRVGRAEQNRIMAVMETLGWQRAKKDHKGTRWWVPGPGWRGSAWSGSSGASRKAPW
jgi:predicted P-loop ATPase